MANRRDEAIKLRDHIIECAQKRFKTHVDLNYKKAKRAIGDIDVTFEMNILRSFPNLNLLKTSDLCDVLNSCRTSARGTSFPYGEMKSHYDGFFFGNPRLISFSYLEASIYRSIFYAQEMGQVNKDPNKEKDASYKENEVQVYIHLILAQLIFHIQDIWNIIKDIYKTICFSCGWSEV